MAPGLVSAVLFATIVAGTPLILTALGELVTEKSGVLNLGAEGIMSVGAVAAFAITINTGSPLLGIGAGMVAGMAMSALFGFAALTLQANQVASGLALSIFGVGLSAFVGKPYESQTLSSVPPLKIPLLSKLPVLGHALFEQQVLVYFSWIMLVAVAWFFARHTRWGLWHGFAGEQPAALDAAGLQPQLAGEAEHVEGHRRRVGHPKGDPEHDLGAFQRQGHVQPRLHPVQLERQGPGGFRVVLDRGAGDGTGQDGERAPGPAHQAPR